MFSLHPSSYWLKDFSEKPPRKPSVLLYRVYVALNGLWFHLTGDVFSYPLSSRRVESWQTERGIRLALQRAGLIDFHSSRLPDGGFVVQARRPALSKPESETRAA